MNRFYAQFIRDLPKRHHSAGKRHHLVLVNVVAFDGTRVDLLHKVVSIGIFIISSF
jgi:hypothetical protein